MVHTSKPSFFGKEEVSPCNLIADLGKAVSKFDLGECFASHLRDEKGNDTSIRWWSDKLITQVRAYLHYMALVEAFSEFLLDIGPEGLVLVREAYMKSKNEDIRLDPKMYEFIQNILQHPGTDLTPASNRIFACVQGCIHNKSLLTNKEELMEKHNVHRTLYSSIALILQIIHKNIMSSRAFYEEVPNTWTKITSSILKRAFGIDEKNIPLEIGVKITDMANDIQKDWLGLLYSESELYNGKVNMLLGDESLKTIVLNLEKRVSQWNLEKLFLSPSWLDEGYKEIIDSWSTDQKTQAEIYFRNMFLVYTLQLELQNLDKEKRKALLEIYTKKAPQEIRLISTPMFEAFQEMLKDPKADLTRILQMVAQCVAECKLKKDKEDLMVYIKDHSIYKMLYLSIALILQEAHEMIAAEWAHERYKL